jgi:aminoglycoside phosphotransferase (APT) family kinase protein
MAAETKSRQETFSGTQEVVERLRFDEKSLAAYMADHVEGFRGPLTVRQFKGGQSNPTYQLITPAKKYVLRRKPPGKLLPSAHAVDREYRVITALGKTGFPVARSYCLCEDETVIGTAFYVMDCVDGRIFWEPRLPGMEPKERFAIYDSMNETFARLHTVDYEKLGLGDFGKPGNYFARQIGRWSKQYLASQTETIPEMDRLLEWLPATIPAGDETTIVHGDYRIDNMIFHPTEPRVAAVLDWELCTLGHPLADFSYHVAQWRMPSGVFNGLADADLAGLGIPTEAEYAAAYCRRTGRKSIPELDWYFAYNVFRLAAILQGIAGRVRDGTASNAQAAQTASAVKPLAEIAWRFAVRAGARA